MKKTNNSKKSKSKNNTSGNFIFRPSITKNGVTYYAKDYGKKAFKIPVE